MKHRSIAQIVLLTICTLGLYSIYWAVVTKRELNQAGGKVPNAILMIIPMFNLYFWYRYAQSYTRIVKKNNEEREVWIYFLIGCLPTIASVTGFTRFISGELSGFITILTGLNNKYYMPTFNDSLMVVAVSVYLITIFAIIITKLAIFQEGYNEYQK